MQVQRNETAVIYRKPLLVSVHIIRTGITGMNWMCPSARPYAVGPVWPFYLRLETDAIFEIPLFLYSEHRRLTGKCLKLSIATCNEYTTLRTLKKSNTNIPYFPIRPSQRPRGLRRSSAAARFLGLRVRFPSVAWMFFSCECCVLCR